MKIGFRNIRGLNRPLKQNGVQYLMKTHKIDVMEILVTKLGPTKLQSVLRNKFLGEMQVNNFIMHRASRILILWDPMKANLTEVESTTQAIHCIITRKVPSYHFKLVLYMVSIPLLLVGLLGIIS